MAPRGVGVAKKQAGAKANPKGAPDANPSAADSDLDETRFASLTTDMCLPHYFGHKVPLEFAKAEQKQLLASFPAGLFVDKGQAGPSVIAPSSVDESAEPDAVAAHDRIQEELLSLRDEVGALYAALRDRDAELAELRAAGAQARESWTHESEDWFREAEQAWKAGEASRLAAAEAKWQQDSTTALVQARSEAEDELRRVREESSALKATLAERDTALAQMHAAGEQAREGRTQAQDLLREAEQAWKTGEAERLKAAEAKWQEHSTAAFVQVRSEVEAARTETKDELRRAREESTALKATLTERDTELARMRAAGEQARDSGAQAQDLLREAEQAWKAGETARFAAAEAKWRENSISSLTRLRTEAEAARTKSEDELRRAREETAALKASLAEETATLKASLAERDTKLAEMQSAAQQAAAAALAKAQAAWKADEAARLAAAETQWRRQSANALADATGRYEAAEGALAQLRQDAARERSDAKAASLAQARPAVGMERRNRRSSSETEDEVPPKKHTFRDVCVVAAFAVAVIVAYPSIAPYLPQSMRSNIAAVTGEFGPINGGSLASPPSGSLEPAGHAIVARDVNVRANPSPTGKILLTLTRGAKVTTIEKRGNWTSVQVESDKPDAQPVQGWVFSSFLKDEAAGEDTE